MSSGGGACRVERTVRRRRRIRRGADPRRRQNHHSPPPADRRRPQHSGRPMPLSGGSRRSRWCRSISCAQRSLRPRPVQASDAIDPISAAVEPACRRTRPPGSRRFDNGADGAPPLARAREGREIGQRECSIFGLWNWAAPGPKTPYLAAPAAAAFAPIVRAPSLAKKNTTISRKRTGDAASRRPEPVKLRRAGIVGTPRQGIKNTPTRQPEMAEREHGGDSILR